MLKYKKIMTGYRKDGIKMMKQKEKNGIHKLKTGGVSVNIKIDVNKIVKYLCVTGVLVVSIVFGSSVLKTFMEAGGLKVIGSLEKGKKISE